MVAIAQRPSTMSAALSKLNAIPEDAAQNVQLMLAMRTPSGLRSVASGDKMMSASEKSMRLLALKDFRQRQMLDARKEALLKQVAAAKGSGNVAKQVPQQCPAAAMPKAYKNVAVCEPMKSTPKAASAAQARRSDAFPRDRVHDELMAWAEKQHWSKRFQKKKEVKLNWLIADASDVFRKAMKGEYSKAATRSATAASAAARPATPPGLHTPANKPLRPPPGLGFDDDEMPAAQHDTAATLATPPGLHPATTNSNTAYADQFVGVNGEVGICMAVFQF